MISVVIPLYNKQDAIIATLQSVKSQTYYNWECIIVDDGSTDNSSQLVKNFIKEDNRFYYCLKANGGPSSARNLGVKQAKGEWITFLDADDKFEYDALYHFAHLTREHKGYRLYCCNFFVDKDGKRTLHSDSYIDGEVENNFKSWFYGTLMPCQGTTLYDRNLLIEHPINEQLRRFEDASMLFDIMRTERIYRSSKPTFTYIRSNSEASGIRKNFQEDFFAHLQPKGKPFWEQMILYDYYKTSFVLYGKQAKAVYNKSPFSTSMTFAIKLMHKWLKLKQIICK